MVEYDAASHNYVVSISSGGGKKSFDVLEPFEERTLSGADELRMIRDLESLL